MPSDTKVLSVFLSVGSAYTAEQESFIRTFEEFLLRNGCMPHTVGRNVYKAVQPVRGAREEMQSCDAAIILAFARYNIDKGAEFPRSPKERPIDGLRMPTVWNQLEGGMAYGLGLPMLILIEEGLTRQGILGERSEWFPQVIELTPAILKDNAFSGIFEDWKRRAKERVLAKERESSVFDFFGRMRMGTALRLVAMLGSLLAAAFWFGHWVAQKFGPLL